MNAGQRAIRVMHVASGDLWAGAEAQVYQLVTALNRLPGVTVAAALLNEGELADRMRQAGIEVRVIPERALGSWTIYRRLLAYMLLWRPDIVHTHRQKENILGALAAHVARVPASVRTTHGAPEFAYPAWQLHKRALRRIDVWVARRIQNRVIAVSSELGAKLQLHFVGAKVEVIANGIDAEAVRHAASPAIQLESAYRHIAFVGRLVHVKRVDVFLEAAAALESSYPGKYRFHVLGDGPLRSDLEKTATDLGISNICIFHGFQPDALRWLASMHCLVLTSDHEGLPMVVLEARALGIPVVAHAVGGLVSLLAGQTDCRLVLSQSPQDIASKIRDITGTMRGSVQTTDLSKTYRIDETAQAHAQLYTELHASHPRQMVAMS